MQVEKHRGGMFPGSCDISSALDWKVTEEELKELKNVHRQTNDKETKACFNAQAPWRIQKWAMFSSCWVTGHGLSDQSFCALTCSSFEIKHEMENLM